MEFDVYVCAFYCSLFFLSFSAFSPNVGFKPTFKLRKIKEIGKTQIDQAEMLSYIIFVVFFSLFFTSA